MHNLYHLILQLSILQFRVTFQNHSSILSLNILLTKMQPILLSSSSYLFHKGSMNKLWKPYCINLAHWKSTQALPQPHTISTKPLHTSRYNRDLYTYSCICGLPDQQHENNNSTCPPLGLALRKIEIWSYNWIK